MAALKAELATLKEKCTAAGDTSLAGQVAKLQQKVADIETKQSRMRDDIQEAKQEAMRANQRLDNMPIT